MEEAHSLDIDDMDHWYRAEAMLAESSEDNR